MRHLTEERGYTDLRPSLGPLLSLTAIEARSLSALASQLSISPQACSQLVNVGESAGYVERQPDPEDGRARVVALTDRGRSLVDDAVRIVREIETDYRGLVGADAYAQLTRALTRLFHGLGIRTHADAALSATSTDSIGVLPLLAVRVQQDLMNSTTACGHAGLKMSHAQVLPLIGLEGARVHELARIQRVSRQAISATARDLEGLGYLRREPDPRDRRGVVFRLTDRGSRLIEDSVRALGELDESFRRILKTRALHQLQSVARALYQSLHLEEEIFEARVSPMARRSGHSRRGSERETKHASVGSFDRDLRNGASEIDIQWLAESLRRQLGSRDTERLAALLDARI
jgi:DNA-binding MarR family transcriptional regulator